MPASIADSAIYRGLFGDEDTARLFSDTAELRAMLLVEGALARVQGALGVIPAEAGTFLHRAASEVQIDPAALRGQTAQDGVPVPALVAAFRKAAGAPDHAPYAHWGATSQDIMDTGLALRLKRVLELWEDRLRALLAALATLAEAHADLPMAARTYGQIATPTSFGALAQAGGGRCCAIWKGWSRCGARCCACRWGVLRAPCRLWGQRGRRCGRGWPRTWGWPIRGMAGTRNATGWRGWPCGWRGWRAALARWARI